MKTIAQQLNIKNFPFRINDNSGNRIYYEDSKGYWIKREFDSNNNLIYYENSDGDWEKQEYDSRNNKIYYENSGGYIRDNRPKSIPEYTMEELTKLIGKEFKLKIQDTNIQNIFHIFQYKLIK